MSEISYDGFLSSVMPDWIEKVQSQNKDWWEFFIEINRFGERLANDIPAKTIFGSSASKPLMALLLLVRTLSNFQGALLMSERGMIVEARILTRSILENAFYLSAIQKEGEKFVDRMIAAQHIHAEKFGSQLFSLNLLDEDQKVEIAKYLKSNESEPKSYLNFTDVVRITKQYELYAFYTALSNDSAHPSIGALNLYMPLNERVLNPELRIGPVLDMEETFFIMCVGVLTIYASAIEIHGNKKFADEFGHISANFKNIADKISKKPKVYISPILTGNRKSKRSLRDQSSR